MVGRYHVETYTSGGHKYHRLARSYRDENGRPRKERLVHLGRAATPEEALAAIEKKMEKLYASKHYHALIEAEAGVKRLEDEIKEAWGGALAYWHNGEIPSEEDVLYLRRVGRRRQKVTDPEHEHVAGAKYAWMSHPEYRWDITPEVVKSREPLQYEYRYYADDFTVDIGDRWPLRFLDFLAAIRRLKRKRAEAAEVRAREETLRHQDARARGEGPRVPGRLTYPPHEGRGRPAYRKKDNIATANTQFEPWREGEHDDLLFALCLAGWAWRSFELKYRSADHSSEPPRQATY